MPYDRELADRIRSVLGEQDDLGLVDEKAMFGGLAFMVAGHMAVCAGSRGDLMVRTLTADVPALLELDGVSPMSMGTRTMRGWVLVDAAHLTDAALTTWIERGVAAARLSTPG